MSNGSNNTGGEAAFVIRAALRADELFLWEMLYEAANMAQDGAVSAEAARGHPYLARYVAGWGRAGDVGVLAADRTGRGLGAAWVRLLEPAPGAAADADAHLPELAIAVAAEQRGRGLGGQLLRALFEAARPIYPAISLSVRAENPARRLYERAGFVAVRTIVNRVGGESLVMVAELRRAT